MPNGTASSIPIRSASARWFTACRSCFASKIGDAQLVANPGCYPTSAILALVPLLKAGLIEPRDIIVDSKSGVSGAGRTPKLTTHFPECNESISAYSVGRHRHMPEIDQIVRRGSGKEVNVIFTPHLVPMDRGILTTAYSRPMGEASEERLFETFRDFYAEQPFVRVVSHLPGTKDTSGTNFCDVTVRVVRGRVITISCLDNLIKGASGAAVQNFNLMYGYPGNDGACCRRTTFGCRRARRVRSMHRGSPALAAQSVHYYNGELSKM